MEQNKVTIEQNKVTIDLDRYDELLTAEHDLQLAKQILFNENNTLALNKTHTVFIIDENQVKLVFPCDYNLHLIGLQKKEGENV